MTKPKPIEQHKPTGRPTEYKAEYDELARKFCLLSNATDKMLAGFFEVAEQTINAWKVAHPSFHESIKAGKEGADIEVANAAVKLALGHTVQVIEREMSPPDESGRSVVLSMKVKDVYYPPSATANKFWLINRHGEHWREKFAIEASGPGGAPMATMNISDAEAAQTYMDMLNGAAAAKKIAEKDE